MIVVENLTIQAGAFVLENLSFRLEAGEYAVLMGATGCGKTTLLETLCGLKPAKAGSIQLDGQEVTRLKPGARGIGYVPQDRALFPTMTVWQHLAFALAIRKWKRPALVERVEELADLLHLGRLLDRRPFGLSGGEAQRVALGRALSFAPRVLLLDEPLSALDETTREEMCGLLLALRERTGVTTLHVTHSLAEARRLADRLFMLRDRRLEEVELKKHQPGAPATD